MKYLLNLHEKMKISYKGELLQDIKPVIHVQFKKFHSEVAIAHEWFSAPKMKGDN